MKKKSFFFCYCRLLYLKEKYFGKKIRSEYEEWRIARECMCGEIIDFIQFENNVGSYSCEKKISK